MKKIFILVLVIIVEIVARQSFDTAMYLAISFLIIGIYANWRHVLRKYIDVDTGDIVIIGISTTIFSFIFDDVSWIKIAFIFFVNAIPIVLFTKTPSE